VIRLALRKCVRCKQLVGDDAIWVEVKDKNGYIKFTAKGKILYRCYHNKCLEELNYEKLGWNSLYDYILKEYFTKELPSLLIMKLKEYRRLYTFQQMKGCLESIEQDIKKIQYKDCQHLANLLVWMLKNNMEDYVKKHNQRIAEANEVIEFKFLKVNNSNIKDLVSEDYDILD